MTIFKEDGDLSEEVKDKDGMFLSFVLLKDKNYDLKSLAKRVKEDWDYIIEESNIDYEKGTIIQEIDEMLVAISLIPSSILSEELMQNAKTNRAWKEAEEVAKNHQACLLVTVLKRNAHILDAGALYVQFVASAAKGDNVTGINTLGSVLHPLAYAETAELSIKNESYPIMNLIFVGLYSNDGKTISAYTYGMENFGKKELEVVDSEQGSEEVYYFLYDIAGYVVVNDVTLKDGETIGFSEDQKISITLIKDEAFAQKETLRIGF